MIFLDASTLANRLGFDINQNIPKAALRKETARLHFRLTRIDAPAKKNDTIDRPANLLSLEPNYESQVSN